MAPTKRYRALDTDHLECRSWAHAWEHVTTFVSKVGRSTVYELHLRCTRCNGERFDIIIRGQGLDKRRYRHPPGYLITGLDQDWGGRKAFNQNAREELYGRLAKPKPADA
jgi:hypothetical protein